MLFPDIPPVFVPLLLLLFMLLPLLLLAPCSSRSRSCSANCGNNLSTMACRFRSKTTLGFNPTLALHVGSGQYFASFKLRLSNSVNKQILQNVCKHSGMV